MTPYGTRHCTTWAGIVRKLTDQDPEAARELLGGIAGLPGYPKLGGGTGRAHRYFHPQELRSGLAAPPELDLRAIPLGSLAVLSELSPRRGATPLCVTGMLLEHGQGAGRSLWVGATRYIPGVHKVELARASVRRGGGES